MILKVLNHDLKNVQCQICCLKIIEVNYNQQKKKQSKPRSLKYSSRYLGNTFDHKSSYIKIYLRQYFEQCCDKFLIVDKLWNVLVKIRLSIV